MAKAGELLMSGTVYDEIHGLLPADRVSARGQVALRGKSEPTPVYAVDLAGAKPR
jgi:class 3 adenylate cyclase